MTKHTARSQVNHYSHYLHILGTLHQRVSISTSVQPAATQSLSAINYLKCPLCLCILHRRVELPCRSLACAECIITCLTLSANNTCSCCYDNSPLTASNINAAPDIVLSLLSDALLQCNSSKTDLPAGAYLSHVCNTISSMWY